MARARDPLFDRIVAIGDSVTQGCQNVGVSERSQRYGVPTMIARHVGAELPLPLIAAPGYPPHIDLLEAVIRARATDPELMQGRRVEPEAMPRNFAVAGARLSDVTGLTCANMPRMGRTRAVNRLTELVLNPLAKPELDRFSQLDRAILEEPTLVFLWVGANDVIESVFYPDHPVTPATEFERLWGRVIARLLSETEAAVVAVGLPDVTLLPLLGLFRRRGKLLVRIRRMLEAYNEIMAASAGRSDRVVYVDLQPEMLRTHREGIDTRGWRLPYRVRAGALTFKPLCGVTGNLSSGGLVSYDGLHPTATGYAHLTNSVLAAMNRAFALDLPPIDLAEIARTDEMLTRPNRFTWRFTATYVPLIYGPGLKSLEARPWAGTPGRWFLT